jgi:hypothetical protein
MAGYSGSPVFLGKTFQEDRNQSWSRFVSKTWLVGINWGYITEEWEVGEMRAGSRTSQAIVRANTNMSGVIPAWKISDLLHIPALEQLYANFERQRASALDSSSSA